MTATWTLSQAQTLYQQPLPELMFQAQTVHRENFNPVKVQMSNLLSIKTGACPENCSYCPQSGHYNTGLEKEALVDLEDVVSRAKRAKERGATRFCMGGAWRSPPQKGFPQVLAMVKKVRELGMETCLTAGMLSDTQAQELAEAGLDYYNHNLDTSREYYPEIITTRTYDERLDTLEKVRQNGINVCCGGIVGMGESIEDRLKLLLELANLKEQPGSVPLNLLIPVPGTPLEDAPPVDEFEFIRLVALARIMMPKTYLRLSAGRNNMSDLLQTLCFLAGANSIHMGEKLLTTDLPGEEADMQLLAKLGLSAESADDRMVAYDAPRSADSHSLAS